eukprot:2625121-Amphidinium_carterae.1
MDFFEAVRDGEEKHVLQAALASGQLSGQHTHTSSKASIYHVWLLSTIVDLAFGSRLSCLYMRTGEMNKIGTCPTKQEFDLSSQSCQPWPWNGLQLS